MHEHSDFLPIKEIDSKAKKRRYGRNKSSNAERINQVESLKVMSRILIQSCREQRRKESTGSVVSCHYWQCGSHTWLITCIPSVAHGKKIHCWRAAPGFRPQQMLICFSPPSLTQGFIFNPVRASKTSLSSPLFKDTSLVSKHWGFQDWKHLCLGRTEHLGLPVKPELFPHPQARHSLPSCSSSSTQYSRFSHSIFRASDIQG